jgi:MFS family permease
VTCEEFVNGAVNVGMTIVAIWLLDRAGRRPLLLSGTAGMAVGMAITACAFLGGEDLHGALAIVAVIGLLVYTGSFAIGLGPVFWLLIAEVYPLRIRGAAMSVATMANYFWRKVPETKGRSLQEIEQELTGSKA